MDEGLRREMRRAKRSNTSVSVIMVDLDNFKSINDDHGHDVGDQVLVMLARHLTESVREEDIVYRFGGEEFVIVLPGADLDIARERAEEVCRSIRSRCLEIENAILRVTMSAGVAAYPLHGETQEQLISQADKALYRAKQAGRNRVELAAIVAAA